MNNWLKFRKLSSFERSLLIQTLIFLPLTALALHLVGFRRWQSILIRFSSIKEASSENETKLEQVKIVARMVNIAAMRGLYHGNCLQKSLTLWYLLRRNGIRSDLHIGTRKTEGKFEAHAWVEFLGVVLNDFKDIRNRFVVFDRPISSAEEKV